MEALILKTGQKISQKELFAKLVSFGYERIEDSLRDAQFSSNGGTVKIFPVFDAAEAAIDFFGDEIDQIMSKNNNLTVKLSSLTVFPNKIALDGGGTAKPGDFLVHEDYGVGLFSHLDTKEFAGELTRYIVLNYLHDDVLFVPLEQAHKLSSYIGIGRRRPKLSKLGTETWKKTYRKVYEDIITMARHLLKVYAEREIVHKEPKIIHKEYEKSLIQTFGFEETPDQVKTLSEVYDDMEKDTPMDRLICGDVGFGKTEVAIRAAAQAVANGYQVIFLVPTTVLCEQHYSTLLKRFASLPVIVSHLSRFVDNTDQDKILKSFRAGGIDILISTHSVLRGNFESKNLGLLIIDEEQKFGVKDKEKLKLGAPSVDVLTLSATPIPRTLFMSLSGIRDISQIYSVPNGRLAVKTKVSHFDEAEVGAYIEREVDRGGQVYYLHNRVETIEGTKHRLQKKFSKLNIATAHGQMGEDKLVETMRQLTDGRIDILVCSTIIENGLDLPNVNTLIIEEADRFGLSQLHQIRGRVGRSKIQSFALFTYKDKKLSSNAVKRLQSILENSELGSGYNIALSDLEIRGGGNVLGRDQHGNMEAIGLVLYSKLLKQAVEQLRLQEKISKQV